MVQSFLEASPSQVNVHGLGKSPISSDGDEIGTETFVDKKFHEAGDSLSKPTSCDESKPFFRQRGF